VVAGGVFFALVHLFVLATIIEALARRFGGEPDSLAATKLAAYSYTPIWLAGMLYLFPRLAVLWVVACLYALYIAFVGLPTLMRCQPDRAAPYALIAGACAVGLTVVMAGLITALLGVGPELFD
jgi:hypothetical protein